LIQEVLTDIRTRLGEDDTWNVDVRDLEKGLAILWRKKEEPQPEAEIIEADFEDTSAGSED
jgi:hypothetical protein